MAKNKIGIPFLNAALLGAFALLTMGITSVFFEFTAEPIESGQKEYKKKVLLSLTHSLDGRPEFIPIGNGSYDIVLGKKRMGAILPITSDEGYGGTISMLASFTNNRTLLALRVIKHTETPGLGDKIEYAKSGWITQFDNKNLDTIWKLERDGGDFDALTGATITSRAIVNAVGAKIQEFIKQGT